MLFREKNTNISSCNSIEQHSRICGYGLRTNSSCCRFQASIFCS